MNKKIRSVLSDRKSRYIGMVIGFFYFLIYKVSINDFFFGATVRKFDVKFLGNWATMMFHSRGPYIWEPIGYFKFPFGVILNISPLNILLGLLVTVLVSFNVSLFVYTLFLPKTCRIPKSYTGFFGMILGFFTGFVCCVPTFLIPFTSLIGGLTTFFIAIRLYLIPIILVLLTYSAYSTLKRLPETIH